MSIELEKLLNDKEFDKKLKELADIQEIITIESNEEWIYEAILEAIEQVRLRSKWRELLYWYIIGFMAGFGLGLILPF